MKEKYRHGERIEMDWQSLFFHIFLSGSNIGDKAAYQFYLIISTLIWILDMSMEFFDEHAPYRAIPNDIHFIISHVILNSLYTF
jgi:hypothetical protein